MKDFVRHGYDGGPNGDGDGETDAARRESFLINTHINRGDDGDDGKCGGSGGDPGD